MDKSRGLRPKHGGIEIRATFQGRRYSWFFNKPWNRTNCAEAARVRKQKLEELKEANNTGDHLRSDNPLFQQVAQQYLDYARKRLSPEHCRKMKLDLNKIWLPYLGTLPIKHVKVRHVRQADTDHEWSSAKRQQNSRSMLRQVFDFAIEDDLIDENPATRLKKVSHQRAKIDPFTQAERDAILQSLPCGQALDYFTLAFETGLRTAELLALDWGDIRGTQVRLVRTLIRGRICKMKTKQERNVFLSPRALQILSPTIHPMEGRIFTLSSRQLWATWQKAIARSGVRYRKPYNTRHTRASLGLSSGQTPAWLAAQLGHDMRTFFERYADYIGQGSDEMEMAKLESQKTQNGDKVGTIGSKPDLRH